MTRQVAFLRAVNVGGRIVKMEDLRKLFASLGFEDVQTYIQSGNVLFTTSEKDQTQTAASIEKKLRKKLGYDVRVFLRTTEELQQMLEQNPFKKWKPSADLKLYVTFLDELKQKPRLPMFSRNKDLEIITIVGKDAFTLSRPYKGKFGFPNLFLETALKVQGTTRNWDTVTKLLTTETRSHGEK